MMAILHLNDIRAAALTLWAANHPEWRGTGTSCFYVQDLLERFYDDPAFAFTRSERNYSDWEARDGHMESLRATLGMPPATLPSDGKNFQQREINWFDDWHSLPPSPAP